MTLISNICIIFCAICTLISILIRNYIIYYNFNINFYAISNSITYIFLHIHTKYFIKKKFSTNFICTKIRIINLISFNNIHSNTAWQFSSSLNFKFFNKTFFNCFNNPVVIFSILISINYR